MCSNQNRLIEAILIRTYNIPLSRLKTKSPEIIPNTIMSAAVGFLLGTQERIRNSRDKRAISVRASEVLLYYENMSRDTTNPAS